MKLVPLGDNIVVRRTTAKEQTAGGIVLPDSAKDRPNRGRVLSVGEGKQLPNGKRASPTVREGDRVLFTSYAGSEIEVDGEKLLVMSQDDILAIIEG